MLSAIKEIESFYRLHSADGALARGFTCSGVQSLYQHPHHQYCHTEETLCTMMVRSLIPNNPTARPFYVKDCIHQLQRRMLGKNRPKILLPSAQRLSNCRKAPPRHPGVRLNNGRCHCHRHQKKEKSRLRKPFEYCWPGHLVPKQLPDRKRSSIERIFANFKSHMEQSPRQSFCHRHLC